MINKQQLLAIGIFEDNNYLDMYVDLIQTNYKRIKYKYKTEKHHIIPRSYYRYNKIRCDDSRKNLVNLLYKDHILAHYYLSLCIINQKIKEANQYAFLAMTFYNRLSDKDIEELHSLDKYQELYEKFCKRLSKQRKGTKLSSETKNKISKSNKGKNILPKTEEHKNKLSDSAKHRRKNSTKGKMCIYNAVLNKKKYVDKNDINALLKDGWTVGGLPHTEQEKELIGKKNAISLRGKVRSEEVKKKTSSTLVARWKDKTSGWNTSNRFKHPSKETVEKRIAPLMGRIWVHKDNKKTRIKKEELYNYIELGWKEGMK